MRKFLPYIIVFAIILTSCKKQLSHNVEIAADAVRNKTLVYYDTVTEDDAYVHLMSNSNTEDLLILINDENPILRYYAFIGLYERNYAQLDDIFVKYKNDEQQILISNGACLKSLTPVNKLFEEVISKDSYYTYLFKTNKYRNTAFK